MQVCGDGRRRFHGVRQPEMQRKLRRLGECRPEQQDQRSEIERAVAHDVARAEQQRQLADLGHVPHHRQPREQGEPPCPGDHQRLHGGAARGLPLVVEADQQEGGDRGQLPVDEQHEEVVGDDQAQHRAHEHQDEGVEAAEMRMTFQISARIEHDEGADAGDQQRERQRQAVQHPRIGDVEGRDPAVAAGHPFAGANIAGKGQEMDEDQGRHQRQNP